MNKLALDWMKINDLYKGGMSATRISKIYRCSRPTICKLLKNSGLLLKAKSDGRKIILDESMKEKIVLMYEYEKFGAAKIGKILGYSESFIIKTLKQNSVNFRSISEGTTLGQTGLKKSEIAQKRMSIAQKKYAISGKRKQTGGICKFFYINGLKCQGTFEKWYATQHYNENLVNGVSIKTPYGSYTPDFEDNDTLLEIKSEYTYEILVGLRMNHYMNSKQYDKILWVSKNVKPVKIIVIDNKKNSITKEIIL